MKKPMQLLSLLIVLALASCSCHDGSKQSLFSNGTQYDPCNMGCVKKDRSCGCSKSCPCWDQHKK